MTDRTNKIKDIVRRLPYLNDEAMAGIDKTIEISIHHGHIVSKFPFDPEADPNDHDEWSPEEKQLVGFLSDLSKGDTTTLIKRLDDIQNQKSNQEYQEAMKSAFMAAMDPMYKNPKFAHYLVRDRGFHNAWYFYDYLRKRDFESAMILLPSITAEDLKIFHQLSLPETSKKD